MRKTTETKRKRVQLYRRCHKCDHTCSATKEVLKCPSCGKHFLPLDYFNKIHAHEKNVHIKNLVNHARELKEEDLVHGLYALWP